MTNQAPDFEYTEPSLAPRRISSTVVRVPREIDAALRARSRRVLIVDDDAERGAGLVASLQGREAEVVVCTTKEDISARVRALLPDVILVHVRGGDTRALAACRTTGEADSAPLPGVLAYGTGDGGDDAFMRVIHAGADDYIADAGRTEEFRERVAAQLRYVRDREVMHLARVQQSLLRDLASTDPLTRLASRRVVVRALERALGAGDALALALVDLDHFKRVNETHGHPVGDRVLRRVARAIAGAAPAGSVTGRWGGGEFAVLWSGRSRAAAEDLGDGLRRAVSATAVHGIHGLARITASVGVAIWEGDGAAPSSAVLLRAVDSNLLRSKQAGRDCARTSRISLSETDVRPPEELHDDR